MGLQFGVLGLGGVAQYKEGRAKRDVLMASHQFLESAGVAAPGVGDQPLLVQVPSFRLLYTARRDVVPGRQGRITEGGACELRTGLAGHPGQADERSGVFDLAHVAQAALVDSRVGRAIEE
jgi:hypothetical protein